MFTPLFRHSSAIQRFGTTIEPRAFIQFVTVKEFPAHAVAAELELQHKTEALAFLRVHEWPAESRSRRPVRNVVADAIGSMPKDVPSVSCTVLCWNSRAAKPSCLPVLRSSLDIKKFNLYSVALVMDKNQRRERPTLSHGLSPVLQKNRSKDFPKTVTAGEFSFLLGSHSDSILGQLREKVPENVSQQIETAKCRISIRWSINSIHIFVDVPEWRTHDSAFLCNPSMSDLVDEIQGVRPGVCIERPG
jgi:hypothetical protein